MIKNSKIFAVLLFFGWSMILVIGWTMIAEAADFYVRENIRNKTGYYTSGKYSDFLWMYVLLSIALLAVMLFIRFRARHWRYLLMFFLIVVFGLFLTLWIEDDIRFGRPIAPEICFTSFIFIFHLAVFSLLSKVMNKIWRDKTTGLFT